MGLATVALDIGLAAYFRRTIVESEATCVACWPLAEITAGRARNIVRNSRHGTYQPPTGGGATGLTHGISVDMPEGALGVSLNGAGDFVTVADDSALSGSGLAGTSAGLDVLFLIKTSTNDATLRAIVQKQVTNSAGNGWHVALQNGAIVFYLEVAGTAVFSFSRGAIADNAWHVVHCHYSVAGAIARIYIDGSLSGATVNVSPATAPAATATTLRIGCFNDDAGAFIGSLSYVTVGAGMDVGISATLNTARQWTDSTTFVREGPGIQVQYGIPGTSPVDRVASTGTLQCALDNRQPAGLGGGVGYHVPGHPNVRTGFDIGSPVRLRITYSGTTYYKFRGTIKSVSPTAGINRTLDARIVAVDWMDVAANTTLTGVSALVDEESWECFGFVTDEADRPPCATSIQIGSEVFPYALDNSLAESMPALTEYQRVAMSDFSKIVVRGDTTTGGVLTFWHRGYIQVLTPSATLDNTMHELDVLYDSDSMVNRAKATYQPRTLGSAGTVLCTLTSSHPVRNGDTVTITLPYVHPTIENTRVGALGQVSVVATTDYLMFSNSDGTGANLTSGFTVIDDYGANATIFTITNSSGQDGYVTHLQQRGTPIYHFDPVEVTYEDSDSVRRYGPRLLSFEMPYQTDGDDADAAVRVVVSSLKSPLSRVRQLSFTADASATLMTQALAREPGDMIELRESVTTGTTYVSYYIQQVRLDIRSGELVSCTWMLAPVNTEVTFWVLGVSTLGDDTVLGWG